MNVLVVPTIREQCILEFLNSWDGADWHVVIVQDTPEPFSLFGGGLYSHQQYCWKDIDQELKENGWIISRHDTAIKSYGFWKAYQMGADYIFVMDDDCLPIGPVDQHIKRHLENLNGVARWTPSVPGQRTRGLPYKNQGNLQNVVLSVGLWEGVPDFDSVYTLGANPSGIELPQHDRIIPQGQYFPMCGMNLCFKREITPLMYFPLMGDGQPYRRFDDIWCGIITKKVCDHLGYHITVGRPFVFHKKASNVFTNLAKEAPGIGANETFWETIDRISLTGSNPVECMLEIGLALRSNDDRYLSKLGEAISTWTALFHATP